VTIELWQVPLLVMAVLVAVYFAYVAVARHWSPTVRLWIKMGGLGVLGVVVLGVGYVLLTRAEPTALDTVLTLMMLVVEGFIGWIGWQQLKATRGPEDNRGP
jgi:drug/metabolite transporter (DMT)-like permease